MVGNYPYNWPEIVEALLLVVVIVVIPVEASFCRPCQMHFVDMLSLILVDTTFLFLSVLEMPEDDNRENYKPI